MESRTTECERAGFAGARAGFDAGLPKRSTRASSRRGDHFHRMKLADAAKGYATFDQKEDDCRKVVLTP
jgi:hypothetical protein